MGNVLRVLGIVLASMLLGLVGLFLLLFTICGGLKDSSAGGILAVCLLLIAGCIGLIVFLGRRIAASRAASRGLAVPPAGAPPAYGSAYVPAAPSIPGYDGPMITPPPPQAQPPYAAAAPAGYPPAPAAAAAPASQTRPVLPLRPFAGTDLQALIGLRVVLALYVVLSIGSMIYNVAMFGRYGGSVAVQLVLRNVLTTLPAVVALIAVSVRNPPAGAALDVVAGYGIASIVFRFGYLAFNSAFTSYFTQGDFLLAMLPRLAGYSLLEAGIAGVALYLRSRVGPIGAPALIVATLGFLVWEGLVQAVMVLLMGALF